MLARALFLLGLVPWMLSACAAPAGPPCLDPLGCAELAPGEPVRIGYLLTFSGAQQPLGLDALGGIELAIQDRQGTLSGHPIELKGEDPGCNREELLAAATRLSAVPDLLGVIGPHCPQSVADATALLTDAGLAAISLGGALPGKPGAGSFGRPGFYRLALDERAQGRLAAEFASRELGARRAAVVSDGSLYHEAIAAAFIGRFTELGGDVVYQGALQSGEENVQPLLDELAGAGVPPQVLFFPLYQHQGDYFAIGARALPSLAGLPWMAADSLLVDRFVANAGSAAEGVYLSGFDTRSPEYAAFLEKWSQRYGEPPHSHYHILAYDAASLLMDAISQVDEPVAGGGLRVGRQALRQRLVGLQNLPGLASAYTCAPSGNCTAGESLGIYQVTSVQAGPGNWPPAPVWPADQ